VLAGNCTDAQIAALLVALRMKGERWKRLLVRGGDPRRGDAFADFRFGAPPVSAALDMSGTGRDALLKFILRRRAASWIPAAPAAMLAELLTFQRRTAFVTAGAGVRVAKPRQNAVSARSAFGGIMTGSAMGSRSPS